MMGRIDIVKLSFALILAAYFINAIWNPAESHLIDSVNLVIHEAGHTIARLFGEFVMVAAGSLFQVIVPSVFVWYFFRQNDLYSAGGAMAWAGQSLANVSVYAKDAIVMQLPLLGGDAVIHDWNYLLSALGILRHASTVSAVIYSLGIALAVAGIYWMVRYSFRYKGVVENSADRLEDLS